jgi:hypothetical protein
MRLEHLGCSLNFHNTPVGALAQPDDEAFGLTPVNQHLPTIAIA